MNSDNFWQLLVLCFLVMFISIEPQDISGIFKHKPAASQSLWYDVNQTDTTEVLWDCIYQPASTDQEDAAISAIDVTEAKNEMTSGNDFLKPPAPRSYLMPVTSSEANSKKPWEKVRKRSDRFYHQSIL